MAKTYGPLVERWRPLILENSSEVDVDFALTWIEIESAGNTCSGGIAGREAGIFQLDLPGDAKFGASFEELQVGCGVGPNGSDLPLTDSQKRLQVTSGLAKVRDCMRNARDCRDRSGLPWGDTDSQDFWCLVKLDHAGGHAFLTDFMPELVRRNGAPSTWAEFREAAVTFPTGEITNQAVRAFTSLPSKNGLRNRAEDIYDNAERVGRAASGTFGNGGLLTLLAVPLLAVFEAMTGFLRKIVGGMK